MTPVRRIVLAVDDDRDDRILLADAWQQALIPHGLRFVDDGEECLDYLIRRGKYDELHAAPRPDLILLDWRMPRSDGLTCLKAIKRRPEFRAIPVVVFTVSDNPADVTQALENGAASYIVKPFDADSLLGFVRGFNQYWFSHSKLP